MFPVRTAVIASFIVLFSPLLFGYVEPTVRVEATFDGMPHGGMLTLTITASRNIPAAELTLEPLTTLVLPVQPSYQLALPAHVPVVIDVPVRRYGGDPTGIIRVKIEGTEGGAARLFYFVPYERRMLRMITASEFTALVEEKQRVEYEEAAERRAAELFDHVIKSGRRPGLIDEPKTVFEREWNRLVRQSRGMTISSDCCCWAINDNNHIYPLTIHTEYYDAHDGVERALREPDYTVRASTTVEEEDTCGNVRYAEQVRHQPTDASANATFEYFTTIVPEGSGNPLTRLETQPPDVGITSCWSCGTMSLVWVEPETQDYSYSGAGTTRIGSVHSTGAHFFRWNDALKEYRRHTPIEGVNSAYTNFKAAYDSTYTGTAAFSPNGSGFAFYGDAGRYIERWVVAHEVGHHLQYALQENVTSFAGSHTICGLANSGQQALGEGFADWYGNFYEIEGRHLYFNCENGECYSVCLAGYMREGNVMAFLWDVFDGVNHGTHDQGADSVGYSQSILNDWANEYADFPTFYEDYRTRGIWGTGEPVTNQLRTVNQVDVAQ